jgi:hypothetical protein
VSFLCSSYNPLFASVVLSKRAVKLSILRVPVNWFEKCDTLAESVPFIMVIVETVLVQFSLSGIFKAKAKRINAILKGIKQGTV